MPALPARVRAIVRYVVQRFRDDDLLEVAGSLTFTTLFSLIPLVTVVFTVISALPVSARFTATLHGFIVGNFVPGAASKLITVYTQQFVQKASHLTALGIGMLGVTAIMLMFTIEQAFNRIWRVRHPRPFLKRVLVYWVALTLGPLLIGASVYMTSSLVTLSLGLVHGTNAHELLWKFTSVALTCIALALLYRTVPSRRVSSAEAAIGGVAAGLAFEAMKAAFAWFVTHIGNYRLVYGAFAGFPVFLLWLYVSWLIVLAGAVITAALPGLRAGLWLRPKVPGATLVEALALLRYLRDCHLAGLPTDAWEAARTIRMSHDDAEILLDRMVGRGWVTRTEDDLWMLARDPRKIPLAECYDEFLFRGGELAGEAVDLGVAAGLPGISGALMVDDLAPPRPTDQPEGPR